MTTNVPENINQYRLRVIEKTKAYFSGDTLLDSGCGDGWDAYLRLKYFKKITATDIEVMLTGLIYLHLVLAFKKPILKNLNFLIKVLTLF